MERNRKDREGGVLSAVAELFDLPADVVAGLPHLAYSDTQIDANTTAGVLRVRGERLTLLAMTAEELRIGGRITAVEWVEVKGG